MSDSDDAKRIARQDRIARGEARKARMERDAARTEARQQAIRAEELRLLAEVKTAKEQGRLLPAKVVAAKPGLLHSPGRGRDVGAIADRLQAKAARDEQDRAEIKRREKEKRDRPLGTKIEPGKRTIDNPFRAGEKMIAVVNLAEHPLEMMLARHRLTQPLYEAGARYRSIYERAAIGPGRGIDPGKVKVDGGKLGDPLSDEVVGAHLELKHLSRAVGMVGERILSEVAGRGVTIADLALSWPGPERERSKRDYLMLRFKEALDVLATEVWGARGPERGRIAGARDLGSAEVDAQAVEVANQTYLRRRGIAL